MTTAEFIIALFYRIDNQMLAVPKHPQASLYPSEVVPLGVVVCAQRRRYTGVLPRAGAGLAHLVPAPA